MSKQTFQLIQRRVHPPRKRQKLHDHPTVQPANTHPVKQSDSSANDQELYLSHLDQQ
jgi:hypothetical protein